MAAMEWNTWRPQKNVGAISRGEVIQNLSKGKFVGPPAPEGFGSAQTQAPSPNEGFVGPKNTGAFAPRTTFGGSQVIDPSGSLAGELYRRLSKSTGRYIPGLEQMWGGQPNADEWRQGADDAYQQARSGLKVNPMTTPKAAGIHTLPAQQPNPALSKFSNGMDATPESAQRAIELGLPGAVAANEAMNPPKPVYGQTPGSAIIKDATTGKVLAQGSGAATGGFSRPKDADKYVQEEQSRVNQFWADVAKQRSMETADRQNSMMTQLDSAIRSGNQEQAAMLTNALKGVGAIQPMNYGAMENQLAEARTRQAALPYIGPSQEAENRFKLAQAGYYGGKNEAETRASIAQSRASALARVLAANKQEKDYLQDPTKLKALAEIKALDPEMYAQFMANR